jgi:ATPase subunit of ABC transporter with duplicated ATPase domains
MTLGYLHQIYSDNENKTVFEELEDGFSQIQSMKQELSKIEEKMKTPPILPLSGEDEIQISSLTRGD